MSDKKRDYGYYGKGTSGYIHYKQDFDRNFPSNKQRSAYDNNNYSFTDFLIALVGLIMCIGSIGLWLLMMYALSSILP